MTAPINRHRLTRRAVLRGGALTVGFVFAGVRTQALAQWATARRGRSIPTMWMPFSP